MATGVFVITKKRGASELEIPFPAVGAFFRRLAEKRDLHITQPALIFYDSSDALLNVRRVKRHPLIENRLRFFLRIFAQVGNLRTGVTDRLSAGGLAFLAAFRFVGVSQSFV